MLLKVQAWAIYDSLGDDQKDSYQQLKEAIQQQWGCFSAVPVKVIDVFMSKENHDGDDDSRGG